MIGEGRVVLTTERLTLQELTDADLDFMARILGDPQVMRFWPRPHTRDEARQWIEKQQRRYAADGVGYWLALERDGSGPVGLAGVVMTPVQGRDEPAIGYILLKDRWGRGYASEAAAACRDYVLGAMGRERVVTLIRPENAPSLRVAERIGMTRVGSGIVLLGLEHDLFEYRRENGE